MTTLEAIELFQRVVNELTKASQSGQIWRTLADTFEKIGSEAHKKKIEESVDVLSHLEDSRRFLKTLPIGDVFVELNQLIVSMKDLDDEASGFIAGTPGIGRVFRSDTARTLISDLEEFYALLQNSVGVYRYNQIVQLTTLGYRITVKMWTIVTVLNSVVATLQIEETPPDNEGELSLFLSRDYTPKAALLKLESLESLYSELARVFDVSTAEYPLKVVRLELGSWWAKLFGENRVIGLMVELLRGGVKYLHRNFTVEGKISSFPKRLEALDPLIELRKKMLDAGLSTEKVDENIEHSAVLISNELNKILGGEPNVQVNQERFYIGEELDEKMLAQPVSLFLTEGGEIESAAHTKGSDDPASGQDRIGADDVSVP